MESVKVVQKEHIINLQSKYVSNVVRTVTLIMRLKLVLSKLKIKQFVPCMQNTIKIQVNASVLLINHMIME